MLVHHDKFPLPVAVPREHLVATKGRCVCARLLAWMLTVAQCSPQSHHDRKYHLQHHYLVVKNYGSHWPLFDVLFGTWQWDTFHPDDKKKKQQGDAAAKKGK